MKTLCKIAALVLPLTVAGAAFAGEPVALSDTQMDNVSAGASAFAFSFSDAIGSAVATNSNTFAGVAVVATSVFELTTINLHESLSTAGATATAQ